MTQTTAFTFRLAGLPVVVQWSAVLMMFGVAAFWAAQGALAEGAALPAVFAVSLLVHEFGHALVARKLKLRPDHILLHAFGGVTRLGRQPRPKEGMITILAGPLAGLALGILTFVLLQTLDLTGALRAAVWLLCWFNLFWSLFNLLPIGDLDGGRFLWFAVRRSHDGRQADLIVRRVSLAVGVIVLVASLAAGSLMLAGLTAYVVMKTLRETG